MGIKGLTKLLQEKAENCFKEGTIKSYFGRTIAIDASMTLYQALIAVRMQGMGGQLMDESGEVTSHIINFFYRTIRLMENGIKPIYVFDGKPPDFKSDELKKRAEKREKAEQELKEAEETGDLNRINQMQKRLTKVDKKHVADVQKLLNLMGIPFITAPGEAEAQCAMLVKCGKVYGTGTEDMDALTFGTKKLIRYLTAAEARKLPVIEFDLDKVLDGLNMNMDQFIDLCILCGCDYTTSIRGIGPKKSFDLISKYKSIENIIKNIDITKYPIPENFQYKEARKLFQNPHVDDCKDISLKFKEPKEEELIHYLVDEKCFSKDRVINGIKRLKNSKGKASQKRLDNFFKVLPSQKKKTKNGDKNKKNKKQTIGKKRKKPDSDNNNNNKVKNEGPKKKKQKLS